ncbi:DEAD-box ATP-dependent RNA helicase 16-like [Lactuca sativa]|uniref:DEAD-box ATP-dependent RNA helicase 16-like n=1 Tax=Lactuca sativa TaxID=4236 RepID=UPI0022AF96CF|nr:DEAD-box ATP-dependent RNA helicase 16-like [Lactuca sativa]
MSSCLKQLGVLQTQLLENLKKQELNCLHYLYSLLKLEATSLSGPPYIFVSTPACVQRCLSSGVLQAKSVHDYLSIIILDKADLIFTYGYEKNLKDLKTHIPKRCQCLLMAATSSLKKLYLHNPYILTLAEVGDGKDEIVPKNVQQFWFGIKSAVLNAELPVN